MVLCLVGWAAASCPCTWDIGTSSLDCSGLALSEVPLDCFDTYPDVKALNLSYNDIPELRRDDFSGKVDVLESLIMDNNPLLRLHPDVFVGLDNLVTVSLRSSHSELIIQPRLFWTNSRLNSVILGDYLTKLPLELFSPNLTAPLTFDLLENLNYLAIPCKILTNLPEGSQVKSMGEMQYFWAQTQEDENVCGESNIDQQMVVFEQCRTVDNIGDCSDLHDAMTPATVQLALAEYVYNHEPYNEMFFQAAFPELIGTVPDNYFCLPGGVDKIWDFQVYYQNTEHVQLDTLYFDLADLDQFTSSMTQSVSIRADTVVLTRQIWPIRFQLNIYARHVVFRFPIASYANLNIHDPSTEGDFFTAMHDFGQINGVIVENFRHGLVHVTVLGSETEPCTSPADVTDILPESTSLTQLDLAVQCSVSLQEVGDEQALTAALKISSWAESLAAVSPAGGMAQVRARAATVRSFSSSHLSRSNYTDPLPVPYLSLNVYADMVEELSWNVQFYKDTIDQLRDKLERQSEAMFDMSMTFEERHADLEFVYQESETAMSQAQSVFGSQQNHLNNLRSHADSVYRLVFDVYGLFTEAANRYNASFDSFQDGIQKAQGSAFIRGSLNFFKNFGNCIIQKEIPNPTDIVDSIFQVSDFVDEFDDLKDELEKSMLLVNDLMQDVAAIIAGLESLDPPSGDGGTDWAAAFADTTQLLSAAQRQGKLLSLTSMHKTNVICDLFRIVISLHITCNLYPAIAHSI